MELSGEILSGYFFNGLEGTQFLAPETISWLQKGSTMMPSSDSMPAIQRHSAASYCIKRDRLSSYSLSLLDEQRNCGMISLHYPTHSGFHL